MYLVKSIKQFFKRKIDIKNFADKTTKNLKHLSEYTTAHTRHFLRGIKNTNIKIVSNRIGETAKRENLKKYYDKSALKINEEVTRLFDHGKRLLEGTKAGQILTKVFDKPWARRTAFIAAGIGALSLVEKTVNGFIPEPAIPDYYNKGYDTIKENMTDFGSPVNLLKTASKTITPYWSSTRRSITTSVNTVIDRNVALFSSKNAIKHTRY